MPASTPNLSIPYPLAADPANVPSDMLALATRIDNLAGSGVFSKAPTRQIFTSGSGTYTTPAGCRAIFVECVGSGGGSGGAAGVASQAGASGGGGAGAYANRLIQNPVASYAYSIGGVGSGGAAGNNNGFNGGDTTFGSSAVVAKGGGGGVGGPSSAAPGTNAAGGVGGASGSCVGDFVQDGGSGQNGIIITSAFPLQGLGGIAPLYGRQVRQTVALSSAGAAGSLYGCGGTGAITNSATAQPGASGAPGLIIVTEFY